MSEYLQSNEFNLTPEQTAYWWQQLEFGENKVNYARERLGLQPMERLTNGDIAAERLNQEAINDENERHRKWRELRLAGAAIELGNAIGEEIVGGMGS